MSGAIACRTCGHTGWQHPDAAGCRFHPRGEAPCACEVFAGPRTATSGNSPAGFQSIRAGLLAGAGLQAARDYERAMSDLRAIMESGSGGSE